MLNDDARPGFALHREGDIAGEVLTEIMDRPSLAVLPTEDRQERRKLPHGLGLMRHENGTIERDRFAVAIGIQQLEPGVVGLAEIDAGLSDR